MRNHLAILFAILIATSASAQFQRVTPAGLPGITANVTSAAASYTLKSTTGHESVFLDAATGKIAQIVWFKNGVQHFAWYEPSGGTSFKLNDNIATIADVFSYDTANGSPANASFAMSRPLTVNASAGTTPPRAILQVDTSSSSVVPVLMTGNAGETLYQINGNGIPVRKLSSVASGSSITPTAPIVHVSGTAAINTIVAPSECAGAVACQVLLIPDAVWTTTTSGNIASASTAVVGRPMIMTYDPAPQKWYASY